MSHLTRAQFNAAKMRCEVKISQIISQIEKYSFRDDVKKIIIKDFGLNNIEAEISGMDFSKNYNGLNKIDEITKRVNSYFSALKTYVALNFDLNVTDYNKAITEAAEFIVSSSDSIVNAALETTEDELLKTYIRAAARQTKHNTKESLLTDAKEKMKKSKTYQKRAADNVRLMLKKGSVDISDIKDDTPIEETIKNKEIEMHDKAVDKEVRNRVLTSIIKIIKEQDFIVKKENVEECGDHAKIYAIKTNGEQANFDVYLDGRFIYKFHEYKGLSCEKDIDDFENKFESIYGVKLEEKQILWSNPDRLDKMAHQTVDTQRIGG